MSIFRQIEADRQTENEKAVAEYWQLLNAIHAGNPTAAQRTKIAALMSKLGKSAAQGEADLEAVANVHRNAALERQIADAAVQVEQADAAHLAFCAERQRRFQEDGAKGAALNSATEDARNRLTTCQTARGELNRMAESHPHLASIINAARSA